MTEERVPSRKQNRILRQTEEPKTINTEQVVNYLSHAFARALSKNTLAAGRLNHKGTVLYKYQVEFCYLIDEIQRGPTYILPKIIQDANQLILDLEREMTAIIEE